MTSPTSLPLSLELRLLRYVIVVAEELHFTRASLRLHIATPSLSKQIRQLEAVLGYVLFERKPRAVALTPAGAAFVTEARRALIYAQRAVEAGATANAGNNRMVRVGYTPLLDTAMLPLISRSFTEAANDATLLFQSTYSTVQFDQILSGRLEAGLVALPIGSEALQTHRVFRDRLIVAIPSNSDLAKCTVIGPDEIATQPIVWFGRLINSYLHQHLVESCQRTGFTPHIAHEVSTVVEMLDLVSSGAGIGFVKDSVRSLLRPQGIIFRELVSPELSIEIGIAYRDENCSANLRALLQALSQFSMSGRQNGHSTVEPGTG
jgi:DNA-binding transcriptional LysR family regulator